MGMRINIEPFLKKDAAASVGFDYTVMEPEKNGYTGLLDADKIDSVNIFGEVSQKNGLTAVTYEITARFSAECARCLAETRQVLRVSGEKYIAGTNEDKENSGDFFIPEDGMMLDLDDFIVEFLTLEVPYRYLCFDKCKGLCPKCGKNLNEGECPCRQKKEKNPAFKILDDYNKKE